MPVLLTLALLIGGPSAANALELYEPTPSESERICYEILTELQIAHKEGIIPQKFVYEVYEGCLRTYGLDA